MSSLLGRLKALFGVGGSGGWVGLIEPLESRALLAAVSWDGGAKTSAWEDAANWSNDQVPGSNDDITLGAGAAVVVSSSITLGGTLTLTGATLEVKADLAVNGEVKLTSGSVVRFKDQAWDLTGTGSISITGGNNLIEVIDGGTLNIGSSLSIYAEPSTSARNGFRVAGKGSLIENHGLIQIEQSAAWFDMELSSGGQFINDGTLHAKGGIVYFRGDGLLINSVGATLQVSKGDLRLSSDWRNEGTLSQSGGVMSAGGELVVGDIGTVERTGGSFVISGVLDLKGGELMMSDATGIWDMDSGTLLNGTLSATGGGGLRVRYGTLDGMTVNGGLMVSSDLAYIDVVNGLTLNMTLELKPYQNMTWIGTQTIGGTGQIVLTSERSVIYAGGAEACTISIGKDITISTAASLSTSTGIVIIGSENKVINYGTIRSEAAAGSLVMNHNTINDSSTGQFINRGTMDCAAGTLVLQGDWSNEGKMTASGGIINLAGTFSGSDVGDVSTTSGEVRITGLLDNRGDTLKLDGLAAALVLRGGTIQGGVIEAINGAQLLLSTDGGKLDGVTFDSDIRFKENGGWVDVYNGLTLNQTFYFNLNYEYLNFYGTQELTGTGRVFFETTSATGTISLLEPGMTLTIGSGITIETGYIGSGVFEGESGVTLINQGTIKVEATSSLVNVSGIVRFENEGTVLAKGGARFEAFGQWLNDGVLSAVAAGKIGLYGSGENNGTIESSGEYSYLFFSSGAKFGKSSTINAAGSYVVFFGGTYDLMGTTFNADGYVGVWSGVIKGGTIAGKGNMVIEPGVRLSGVTLDINADVYSSAIIVDGGLTVNGTLTVKETGWVNFEGTQTLGGSGTVLLKSDGTHALVTTGTGVTLTIGSGVTIQAEGASQIGVSGVFGGVAADIVNKGTILTNGSGAKLTIAGKSFTNLGNLTLENKSRLTVVADTGLTGDAGSSLSVAPDSALYINGGLSTKITTLRDLRPLGRVVLTGGNSGAPRTLEATSPDLGLTWAGFTGYPAYGSLELDGAYVQLVDNSDNIDGAEAVYAKSLVVPAGSTLDLNGLALYVMAADIQGSVINGSVSLYVNAAPDFTASNPSAATADSGPQTYAGWATFNPGAGADSGQKPTYEISDVSDSKLFSALPSVSASGTLTFTPAPGATGTATFKIRVKDDGGTANGGTDTSDYQTFTITIEVSSTPVAFKWIVPFPTASSVLPTDSINIVTSSPLGLIDLNTFDWSDLVLTRDGGSTNLITSTSGVTITKSANADGGGNYYYKVHLPRELISTWGKYELTVNGANVNGVNGHALTNNITTTWTTTGAFKWIVSFPTALSTPPTSSINIVTSSPLGLIDLDTFDWRDLVLTRDGGSTNLITSTSGVTITKSANPDGGGNYYYKVYLPKALISAWGRYDLTVNGANVKDLNGRALTNNISTTWTTTGSFQWIVPFPTASSVLPTDSINIVTNGRQGVIDMDTFDWSDLVLTRDGGSTNLITSTSGVTITKSANADGGGNYYYKVHLPKALISTWGQYELTVNGANVNDLNGRALTNNISTTWTTTGAFQWIVSFPTPSSVLPTNSVNIVTSSPLGLIDLDTFDWRDLVLTRDGESTNLITSTSGVTITKSANPDGGGNYYYKVYLPKTLISTWGQYELTVNGANVNDLNGRALTNNISTTWTTTGAFQWIVPFPTALSTPPTSSINIVTSSPLGLIDLNTFNWSDLILTLNGLSTNLITSTSGVTISKSANPDGGGNYYYKVYLPNGLISTPGQYELTVKGAEIKDIYGRALTNNIITTWQQS